MKKLLLLVLPIVFALAGCSRPARTATPAVNQRVLVVINTNSAASREIGSYYASKRKIQDLYVCRIKCIDSEQANRAQYLEIKSAVQNYLQKNDLKDSIDYIVVTKGIPIRTSEADGWDFSVDGLLAVMWNDQITGRSANPYFGEKKHFNSKTYGMYLVTRLDAYTVDEAKKLVDRSLRAKPAKKGVFLMDIDTRRDGGNGYQWVNDRQKDAAVKLKEKGFRPKLMVDKYPGPEKNLAGYYTWGSNQHAYDAAKYKGNTYVDGALAETVVSTSARTFGRTTGGQSLIADLITAGVTGVKGYVSEPYVTAIADANILFDRYTSGYNLAESFYAASSFVHWRDLVIGDPLCSPYVKK